MNTWPVNMMPLMNICYRWRCATFQKFAQVALGKADFIMPIFVAVLLVGSMNSTMFSASRFLALINLRVAAFYCVGRSGTFKPPPNRDICRRLSALSTLSLTLLELPSSCMYVGLTPFFSYCWRDCHIVSSQTLCHFCSLPLIIYRAPALAFS